MFFARWVEGILRYSTMRRVNLNILLINTLTNRKIIANFATLLKSTHDRIEDVFQIDDCGFNRLLCRAD
jgi:hypothetical protein